MKIDPIFETKIIYFSEKIIELKSSEYILTSKEMDTYIDISDSERIINYLEKEKLIKRGYNNDFDTDGGLLDHSDVDRDGLRELIKKLKQNLREKPAIERNLIVQIARQLETIFDKNKWSSVASLFFSYDENDIYKYIKLERYSLTDFLFYSSYSKEFSIYDFLVEFLNPIYYDIKSEVTSQKVFEFIGNILKLSAVDSDYSYWADKASKYINIPKSVNAKIIKKVNKISSDVEVTYKELVYRDIRTPLQRGLRKMLMELKDNAEVFRNGKLELKGKSVHRNDLRIAGKYKDDDSFRSGLAGLRSKLKNNNFPLVISNETQNKYMLTIEYD